MNTLNKGGRVSHRQQARSTRSSRAICCPQYSAMLSAETSEVKCILTLSPAKPRTNAEAILITDDFIY
jgi:hypothetical protein